MDLLGLHILVIEDEYFLANEIRQALQKEGAAVIGPIPTVDQALIALGEDDRINLAVVDINLRGEMSFPVGAELKARNVPFLFASGYDRTAIPPEFGDVPKLEKPFSTRLLVQTLAALMTGH